MAIGYQGTQEALHVLPHDPLLDRHCSGHHSRSRDVALANSSLEFERIVLLVRFIIEDLMKVLTEQGFPFTTTAVRGIARDVKEVWCYNYSR